MHTSPRVIGLSILASTLLLGPASTFAAKSTVKNMKPMAKSACVIKGNISSKNKEKIYHLPGCLSYTATIIEAAAGERWFCTEKEARDAGWRKALNCPR